WQALAPEALDRAVATCMAKDPDDRWQSARDLCRELKRVAEAISQSGKGRSEDAEPKALAAPRAVRVSLAAAIAAISILVTAIAVWTLKPAVSASPVSIARLSVTLEPGEELRGVNGPPAAL